MKISIITVCFNSASTIKDTIQSVLHQDHTDVEFIIIDGGSNDETMDIVQHFSDQIDCIVSEPDNGIYDAMNKGISHAKGDVIGILNSDDFYENAQVLSNVAKSFENYPTADLIYGDVVFAKPDNLNKVIRHYSSIRFSPWKLRFGWMPPHPATFIRKNAYEQVGQYDTSFRISADYELLVRMLLTKRLTGKRLDGTLVRMRTGGASTSGIRSSWLLNQEIVRACRKNGIYTNTFLVYTKIPFKLLELSHF